MTPEEANLEMIRIIDELEGPVLFDLSANAHVKRICLFDNAINLVNSLAAANPVSAMKAVWMLTDLKYRLGLRSNRTGRRM